MPGLRNNFELRAHTVILDDRPLYKKYDMGTTVWSALASGLLTGKVILSSCSVPPHCLVEPIPLVQ